MKICRKCGAYNTDSRLFCIDCSARLGGSLSEEEEAAVKQGINQKVENLYRENDPLHVNLYDKIVGICALAGLGGLIVCWILQAVWKGSAMHDQGMCLFVGFLFLGMAALTALVPSLAWALERFRLSFIISAADEAEPSGFYRICRKISSAIMLAAGLIPVILFIVFLARPIVPVVKYIDEIAGNTAVGYSSYSGDYIDASPELWEKVLTSGDTGVEALIAELQHSQSTGLREVLMMQALTEMTGIGRDQTFVTKDEWLLEYYSQPRVTVIGGV